MKKIVLLAVIGLALVSCGSQKRSLNASRGYDDNALNIRKTAQSDNRFTIIPGKNRVTYTISDRKKLKGLNLQQAKEKVLAEAVMFHECALIVEPNYSYDMKGKKKVTRITVAGYPGNYNFEESGQ